jgi:hypothetical protein
MPKIQNNFLTGTINKDLDERLTPNGQLIDAENFMVFSEDNSNAGVGKNIIGNTLVNSFGLSPLDNPECIGIFPDEGRNLLYIFITSDTFDYVIKYNVADNTFLKLVETPFGGLLNFSRNNRITHSDIFTSVEDDDLLSWTDGLNPPRIINTNRLYTNPTEEQISVAKPAPLFPPFVDLGVNGIIVPQDENQETNEIEDRFVSFAYRWKYRDGYYSSFSPFSEYFFVPREFSVNYDSMENLGMVNATTYCRVTINTGSEEVIGVDVLFKYEGLPNTYVLDKYDKQDNSWGNNSLSRVVFYNNKRYATLPESQWFRSFDNVPITAKTQARVGNRLVYGNYIEGRDMINENNGKVKPSFAVDVISTDILSTPVEITEINQGQSVLLSFPDELEFKEGTNLFFKIQLKLTDLQEIPRYERTLVFTLDQNYNDLQDFIANSDIVDFIDVVLTDDFNEFVTDNLTYSGINFVSGFVFSQNQPQIEEGVFQINLPVTTYEIEDVVDFVSISGSPSPTTNIFDLTQESMNYQGLRQIQLLSQPQNIPVGIIAKVIITFVSNGSSFTLKIYKDGVEVDSESGTSSATPFEYEFLNDSVDDVSKRGRYTFSVDCGIDFNVSVRYDYSFFNVLPPLAVTYNKIMSSATVADVSDVTYDIAQSIDLFSVDFGDKVARSMKSNRSYEVGIIYKDNQGRKTTVFPSENNTIFIPNDRADKKNTLSVSFLPEHEHPFWAKAYQFVLKQNRREYQTIHSNIFYQDGIYRWVKLEGESKNKVKEGDTLIVKQDLGGFVPELVKLKVLEIKGVDKGELIDDSSVEEDSGLYMRLRPTAGLAFNYEDSTFSTYEGNQHLRYPTRCFTSPDFPSEAPPDIALSTGSVVRIFIEIKARGSIAFTHIYDRTFRVNSDYSTYEDWFDAEVQNLGSFGQDYTWNGTTDIGDNINNGAGQADEWNRNSGWGFVGDKFFVVPFRKGTSSRNITTTVKFEVRESAGNLIFETEPKIEDQDIYFETPQVYLVSQNIQNHLLDRTFNCFSFGNGVESNRYKDRFVAPFFSIDFFPTSVSEDTYRQVSRFADLTWSEVYQESTNVNRLNEFNLSLANFKDDIEKSYGAIVRLDSDETDLLVIQEGKTSKVLYGKDLLFNADATTNLTRINQVFGQQVMYSGEYGISIHPESYSDYGTNAFWTDVNRGVVMRLNNTNGLFEISENGMSDYFKTLFRDEDITNIISAFDSFYDIYILNIKTPSSYYTWYYSPKADGFVTRARFNPDAMTRLNNKLFSLSRGVLYEHNRGFCNTFYGVTSPSTFTFNFSQEPSTRKIFKALSIEGNTSLNVNISTDLQFGSISQPQFINKEGVFFSHIRGAGGFDLKTTGVIGVGILQSSQGGFLTFQSASQQISVGDLLYNQNQQFIGFVGEVIGNTIVVLNPQNLFLNTFVYCVKDPSTNTSGILGYFAKVFCSFTDLQQKEIFAINADISKSFE